MSIDVDIHTLISNLTATRYKEPSFDAVMNEVQHLTTPKSSVLTRRQPASNPPQIGDTVNLTWELFQEDPDTSRKEPGEGEFTLVYTIFDARMTMPTQENEVLVRGEFQVDDISTPDNRTFYVSLREVYL